MRCAIWRGTVAAAADRWGTNEGTACFLSAAGLTSHMVPAPRGVQA